jgi:hypothetical protein
MVLPSAMLALAASTKYSVSLLRSVMAEKVSEIGRLIRLLTVKLHSDIDRCVIVLFYESG